MGELHGFPPCLDDVYLVGFCGVLAADRVAEAFFDVRERGAAFSAAFLALYPAGERLSRVRLCLAF